MPFDNTDAPHGEGLWGASARHHLSSDKCALATHFGRQKRPHGAIHISQHTGHRAYNNGPRCTEIKRRGTEQRSKNGPLLFTLIAYR